MSGGTWIAQNKIRPGAYINFKTVPAPASLVGTRGITTIALNLKWGAEDSLINLYSEDLTTGNSLSKVGLMLDEAEAKLLRLILSNSYLCKVYRLNTKGTKATATVDKSLKVTAKYSGEFGNKIVIVKEPVTEGVFEITTYANGYEVDNQRIEKIEDLKNNEFVEFEKVDGEDTQTSTTLTVPLSEGTDGTVDTNAFKNYLNLLRTNQFQTIANVDTEKNKQVVEFIKDMRENEGIYVQAVINDAENTDSDYEGIINNINGVVINDETITPAEFTSYVAGLTAGASFNESNTGKVIEGATSIVGLLSNTEIIEALKNGKFVLSLNQDGNVKVEKDINSLHTYTEDKNYIFSKNRVIRTLDEIGSSIKRMWENTYLGKVSNTDSGRTMFKSSIINYLTELENNDGIQAFDSSQVEVYQGDDIDSVVANILIKPVDSMEFLYLTVTVDNKI